MCAVPVGRDPIEDGHEAEAHRGGRGAAEGGRAQVEAQAQIFVGTAANRRLAGERESERDREAYGAPGTGGIYAVYISHTHILTRAHTKRKILAVTSPGPLR